MKTHLKKLEWIARLSQETKGLPSDEQGLRELLNRIVVDVRQVLREAEEPQEELIPVHGGYRQLKAFQVAEIVYDGTVIFCDRFVSKRSRTTDQMIQAARSGRQNIAEGSMAAATSKKTELTLTNVAKASLEELLLDYEDYLRQHRLPQWDKNDPQSLQIRRKYCSYPDSWFKNRSISASGNLNKSEHSDLSDEERHRELLDPYGMEEASAEDAANTMLCLLNQATYLLKRLIKMLEQQFLEEGGFSERLYRCRTAHRKGTS